jgi:predicted lipid-binding transport protein (Tim44 family)
MMKRTLSRILALTVIMVFFIYLLPPDIFARAGRGGSYRAPSRSSSSSSRSSSGYSSPSRNNYSAPGGTVKTYPGGGSTGAYYPPSAPSRTYGGGYYPMFGGCCGCGGISSFLFLVIIVLIILYFVKKNKNNPGDSSNNASMFDPPDGGYEEVGGYDGGYGGPPALPPIDEERAEQQINELKAKDSNFSSKVFLDKIQTYFFEIQRAWARGDMESVRNRMSESQFTRMNFQLEELKEKNWKCHMEDLVIGGVKVAEAGSEGGYDFIKVRINASARDYTTDPKDKIVEGSKDIQPFSEYWTFIRKQGQKTNEDGGRTPSQNCPSCGAPLESIDVNKCPYCGTVYASGSFDWVLDSISQSIEEENYG